MSTTNNNTRSAEINFILARDALRIKLKQIGEDLEVGNARTIKVVRCFDRDRGSYFVCYADDAPSVWEHAVVDGLPHVVVRVDVGLAACRFQTKLRGTV